MKIYLDDVRFIPDDTWTECKDVQTFVDLVLANLWNIEEISFDHDLWDEVDGKELTGYDCLIWFIKTYQIRRISFPRLSLHTANPIWHERMETAIIMHDLYKHYE